MAGRSRKSGLRGTQRPGRDCVSRQKRESPDSPFDEPGLLDCGDAGNRTRVRMDAHSSIYVRSWPFAAHPRRKLANIARRGQRLIVFRGAYSAGTCTASPSKSVPLDERTDAHHPRQLAVLRSQRVRIIVRTYWFLAVLSSLPRGSTRSLMHSTTRRIHYIPNM